MVSQQDQGPAQTVGPAFNLHQLSLAQMLAPGSGAFRRHDEVDRYRLARPDVEVLPLKDGVERPAHVKGQRVIFDTEEDHHTVRPLAHALGELRGSVVVGFPTGIAKPAKAGEGDKSREAKFERPAD